jgi:D-alanyl-lipoteichoic acid acyltransferase DltB (MBOAT superfamily)
VIFNSFQYAAFLGIVLVLYWLSPKRFRPLLLLVASYVFYASWNPILLTLLGGSTLVTWFASRSLPGAPDARRRAITAVAVLASVGVLAVFKALEAFADSTAAGLGSGVAEAAVPIGLSFFTFQAISYVVDVYRRDLEPDHSFVDVALYIAFFPHLLAGPIVRASKLIPAFHSTGRRPDPVRTAEGAELILVGLFKKVALADPIIGSVLTMYERGHVSTLNGTIALVAGVIGAYFDITGYVDMARGSAKLLGIDMQRNALYPLLRSTGYADFWRRWQLTVMMWFRDYVFLPVRGSKRKAPGREYLALFVTFAVLGLWHGASPGWALWGILSGIIIVAERSMQTRRAARRRARIRAARRAGKKPPRPVAPAHWRGLVRTYVLVALTLPLISSPNLDQALDTYLIFLKPSTGPADWNLVVVMVIAVVALLALDGRERRREARAGKPDPVTPRRAVFFAIAVVGIITFSGAEAQPFLYFAF